jgi:hypothetical protein
MSKLERYGILLSSLILASGAAQAQGAKSKAPAAAKPPQAQAWLDVATFSGFGMGGAPGANPMAMLGGLFGGSSKNQFGNTVMGPEGKWLDVTLYSRLNPNLGQATQTVPVGSKLAPSLELVAPRQARETPTVDDDSVVKEEFERPKGKLYLYWGCGDAIRSGQPKVLDMAKASMADIQKFFVSRRATQRGAHLASGRPSWPNEQDNRVVPGGASLIGEHAFKGQGVPESFHFNLGQAQDFMAPIELKQRDQAGATVLEWQPVGNTRAYFISAMGAKDHGDNEMVFWTSSDLPEIGTGLIDYQTNSAVDKWLDEKVLLPATARNCVVPKGIFGEGAMLRMIAYGNELNLVHPPRPADPKISWEPQWSAKVRVKSVTNAMLGMDGLRMGGKAEMREDGRDYTSRAAKPAPSDGPMDGLGQGLNKLKGLFGF